MHAIWLMIFLCLINKVKYVNLTHLDKSSYFGNSYGSYDQ